MRKAELRRAWKATEEQRDNARALHASAMEKRDEYARGLTEARRIITARERTIENLREPIPRPVRVAALAVVMILDQHADVLATDVGAGVRAYKVAYRRVRDLERLLEVDGTIHQEVINEATALYNELTT